MTDVHAAIGLAQLSRLEEFNAARIANAAYFNEHLEGVITPTAPEGYRHVYHQYTVRAPDGQRDALMAPLKENDIGFGVYYPVPIHKQTYYVNELGYDQSLPEAERAVDEVLSLPVHPALSQADREKIVGTINAFMEAA